MKRILLVFLCLSFLTISAQEKRPEQEFGDHVRVKKGQVIGLVAIEDNGYYILRKKRTQLPLILLGLTIKTELFLDYYTKDLKFVRALKIGNVGYGTGRLSPAAKNNFEFLVQTDDGNIYVFYSKVIAGETALHRIRLNKKSFLFDEDQHIISVQNSNNGDRRNTFVFYRSPNNSHQAVVSVKRSKSKKATTFDIAYLDKSLNKIDVRNETLDYKLFNNEFKSISHSYLLPQRIRDEEILLSNKGVLIMLAGVAKPTTKLIEFSKYKATLIAFHPEKHAAIVEEIKVDGYWVDNTSIVLSDSILVCVGIVIKPKTSFMAGVFKLDLNPGSLQVKEEKTDLFDLEDSENFLIPLVDKFTTKRERKSNNKRAKKLEKKNKFPRANAYPSRNLIQHKDNSLTLILEYYDYSVHTMPTGNGMNTTSTTYYYGDLVFIHLNGNGEIEWIKNIAKGQVSSNQLSTSNFIALYKDTLHFVYEEDGSDLMHVRVDVKGKTKKELISETGRKSPMKNFQYHPANPIMDENGKIICVLRKSNHSQLMSLEF